jgi:hypothetical protein
MSTANGRPVVIAVVPVPSVETGIRDALTAYVTRTGAQPRELVLPFAHYLALLATLDARKRNRELPLHGVTTVELTEWPETIRYPGPSGAVVLRTDRKPRAFGGEP